MQLYIKSLESPKAIATLEALAKCRNFDFGYACMRLADLAEEYHTTPLRLLNHLYIESDIQKALPNKFKYWTLEKLSYNC